MNDDEHGSGPSSSKEFISLESKDAIPHLEIEEEGERPGEMLYIRQNAAGEDIMERVEDWEDAGSVLELDQVQDFAHDGNQPAEMNFKRPLHSKRGRNRTADVVKILNRRVLPQRAARVQSFKELQNGFAGPAHLREPDAEPDVVSHDRPIMMRGERSRVSRVFVQSVIDGMHIDWPIFSYHPLPWSKIAHILMTEAAQIPNDRICESIPQEFTDVGCFIVDLKCVAISHEIIDDSLGSWGKPSGTVRHFSLDGLNKIIHGTPEHYHLKVNCSRYNHPGTDDQGRFSKKVYVGTSHKGESSSHAIIQYEWIGIPHPISVVSSEKERTVVRPQGQRSWEARNVDLSIDEQLIWRGVPIFSQYALDFESVKKILLADVEIVQSRICQTIPNEYCQVGTFVIMLSEMGGESMLHRDGHAWTKPSGQSRFYRLDGHHNALRVDKIGNSDNFSWDVKILYKRYDCETPSMNGFVRKIYTCKEREGSNRINNGLAVIVYMWKGDPFEPNAVEHKPRDAPPAKKIRIEREADTVAAQTTTDEPLSLGNMVLPHADHLKRLSLAKELENQNRLSALLERAEAFLDRFESAGHSLGLLSSLSSLQPTSRTQFVVQEEQIPIWEDGTIRTMENAGTPSENPSGRRQADQIANSSNEYVTPNGERIELPPGSYIMEEYETTN